MHLMQLNRTFMAARSCPVLGQTLRRNCAPLKMAIRSAGVRSMATKALKVGDKLPGDKKFAYFDPECNLKEITVKELTEGKKVVLFAVPGAFTPICSNKHLPGFIQKADEFKRKGIDTVACVSVNDAFVMSAWSKATGVNNKICMLADGSGEFTKAIGTTLDLSSKGLGVRSMRYAMLVDNGVVKVLSLEDGGAFEVSSAEDLLTLID